jgi:hypothetical protein
MLVGFFRHAYSNNQYLIIQYFIRGGKRYLYFVDAFKILNLLTNIVGRSESPVIFSQGVGAS